MSNKTRLTLIVSDAGSKPAILPPKRKYAGITAGIIHPLLVFSDLDQARVTLPLRRHRVQTYTWQRVPLTIAFTRFILGFQVRLLLLWEWLTWMPKATSFPQNSQVAIAAPPYHVPWEYPPDRLCRCGRPYIIADEKVNCKWEFGIFLKFFAVFLKMRDVLLKKYISLAHKRGFG